jgi:hypothetical protein
MKGKKENITITLKKADKITMKFLDGKILSGEVTNIKAECAEAILLQPDDRDNIAIHHLEISATPFCNASPVLAQVYTFSEAAELWNIDSSTLRHRVTSEKLLEGIDYKKSGKVWLITRSAMQRLYGFL